MTRRLPGGDRWFTTLLVGATLLQSATAVARPMASYRALHIGMPPETLGLVATAFAIAPVILALWIGRRVDRHGPFPFLAVAALLQATAAVSLVFVGDTLTLLAGVAVLGLSQLVFVVANQTLVGSRSHLASYDQRFSSLSFVASLGQLIGPASAGLIAGSDVAGGAGTASAGVAGTGLALLFGASLSMLAVPVIVLLWRRDPGPVVTPGQESTGGRSVRDILRMPGMAPAMLASLTVLSVMDVLVVYLPALGEERGLSVAVVGALLSVRAGASMASRLALARMIGRFGRPRLMVGSLLVAAVAVVALAVLPLPLMFVAMAVAGGTLGVTQPMTMSWVAARATHDARGMAMSLRLLGNRAGQVVIPLAAGTVAAVTGAAGVLAAAGITLGVTAAVVASRRPQH
jgi:MFS family permease